MITAQQIAIATGARIDRAAEWYTAILEAMDEFEINTPARMAAFLAQIGHESGGLHWLCEIWGPTLAQAHYEGRKDLGNVRPGDGFLFKGRGLIQITGRANYQAAGDALGVDFMHDPAKMAATPYAARCAAWFWKQHGLNELADVGDFHRITLRINGGTNGMDQRVALWNKAKQVIT